MSSNLHTPDWLIVAVAVLVSSLCAYCIFWMLSKGRPLPKGKVDTQWEFDRSLMWVEVTMTTCLLIASLVAALWFAGLI